MIKQNSIHVHRKDGAARFSETIVSNHYSTGRKNPENHDFYPS